MNTDTLVLLLIFTFLFLDDNVNEEYELVSNSKISDSACIHLIFCQFEPDVAYERVAVEKDSCSTL